MTKDKGGTTPVFCHLVPKSQSLEKMYKNVLQAIDGIEIYPLISFGIFFLFFLGLIVYVALMDKKHVQDMSYVACGNEDENTTREGVRQ